MNTQKYSAKQTNHMNRYRSNNLIVRSNTLQKSGWIVLSIMMAAILIQSVFFAPLPLSAQDQQWNATTHDKTNFPLTGKHRDTACSECHLKGVMQGTPTQCEECHWHRKQDDRYKLQLGIHCEDCHTPFDWKFIKPNSWDHFQVTGYARQGIHKTLDCFQCHKNNAFTTQPNLCYDCHREDYQKADEPNHTAGNFPTDCEVCHKSQISWEGARFDHSVYPLSGAHLAADCSNCHVNGQYSGTNRDCSGCHMDDYNNAKDPDHKQAGYPTDCESCHGTLAVTWEGAVFNHSFFQLNGAHQTADCTACHINGQYSGTPRDCSGCHIEDYNNTKNPNHQQAGYSTDCESCHGSEAVTWTGVAVDHSSFPLRGAHQSADCTDCHINGQFSGTTRDCSGCHMDNYNNTTNPNHQQAGYSTDCESCHGNEAVTWTGATVDHSSFPLRGAHQTADCTACHINGQFSGTTRDCSGCHMDNYNNTTNPNHQQAGYSTDCESCHGNEAVTWTGATVDHSAFPLRGRHLSAACTDCHTGGQYQGLSQECVSCHQEEYNGTTEPNHQQAGFSTDCVPCHGSEYITWSGAVFDHNQFFRLQGPHTTLDCNACHAQGYDLPTDCYGCHRQDYENSRNPNHQQAGFPTNCEACHLATHMTWQQAVFNHQFPISSGNHSGLACTDCHLTANYQVFSCIDCHEHSKSAMDNEHDDVNGYTYNSQACYSCHPQGRGD